MLLYAFFSHPGGVILQDYESCVLYLYPPPHPLLFLLLFISSNYVFHPINLSLNIYLYPPHCLAGRLICSFTAKHFLISPRLVNTEDFNCSLHVAHIKT